MERNFPQRLRNALAKLPLGWVFVVPFVLQTVGAVGLIGYFSYQSGQDAGADLAGQWMDAGSQRVRDRLDAYLQVPQQAVAAGSQLTRQGSLSLVDRDQVRSYLWWQINLSPLLGANFFANQRGERIGYWRLQNQVVVDVVEQLTGEHLPIGTLLFAEVRQPKLEQQRYYRVDPYGKPQKLVYTLPINPQVRNWLRVAATSKQQSWSPILIDSLMPMPGAYTMASASDAAGTLQGTFAADCTLSTISTYLSQLKISPSGQTFIVDRSGALVATSTHEMPFRKIASGQLNRQVATNSKDKQTRAIAQQLLQQFGDWRHVRSAQYLKLVIDHQQQFVYIMPYQNNGGLDWLIVTAVPSGEVMTAIEAHYARTVQLSLLTLLVTTGLGILTARWLTKTGQRFNQSPQQTAEDHDPKAIEFTLQPSQARIQNLASEERFRQIATTSDQLFFVRHACTGQFLYISPAYEKIWGRSCESLYNNPESWLEAIHPDDRDRVVHSLRTQFQAKAVSREYRIVRPDGTVRWIMAQVSPLLDDNGQPLRYAGFAVDMTERKQAEEQLRENEATNRALLQAIPDLLIRMGRDGTYLDIHHGGTIKLFNPSATYIGAHISQSMPEATVQDRLFYMEEALRTGEVRIYEQQLRIEDELRYEEVRILPCAEDEVLIIVRDITSRKRTEAALRESEERFRRAFDDAAVGMTLVALDGRFLRVNRALCQMVGYSEPELLQRTFQDITHTNDLEMDLTHVQKIIAGEISSFQLEKRYIHKQGHTVWVLLSVSIVRHPDGIPLYFVSQIQDISDRHKIDRLKDEFISVVSHELRTPLTAIRGSLGILETGIFDNRPEQAKHMLQVALNNSDRLVRLVNDILDLERLESGKVPLNMQRCQVADLMQQAIDLVQTIATQAEISLQLTPLVAEMTAAPDAIVQTLTNLLSNAIKFSAAGSTVWLTATVCLPGHLPAHPRVDPAILFSVKDQGRGIPADKIETIFGRFQQVDASDARQKGGTGLGLAICESIVRQHNGRIWAESVLGEGSTFYFTIPLGDSSPVLMQEGAGFGETSLSD